MLRAIKRIFEPRQRRRHSRIPVPQALNELNGEGARQ